MTRTQIVLVEEENCCENERGPIRPQLIPSRCRDTKCFPWSRAESSHAKLIMAVYVIH